MLSTKTQFSKQWLIDFISLAILLTLFYGLWIGSYALFTPDEGRYSEVAREMVTTGDFITPRLNGVVFLDKPILYYWLQASAIELFGVKEWALRFWPAFMGVFGSLMAYLAGRLLFNRRTGILSALILATCPLYYGAAHYANLDLEVSVLIATSLLAFIVGIQASKSRRRTFILLTAYGFAGLAVLTKGLIGIAFPIMVIGAWILLLNRWSTLKQMRLISGLLIFAVISIPWYILVQKANPQFFEFFFVKQQVSRFLTTEHFNNRTTPWFYVPIVLAGMFPWCIFVFQALVNHFKSVWQNRQKHASELFLLLWVVLVFTFFSIPKSKTVGYILPIFPALALLTGHYLDTVWNSPKSKGMRIAIVSFLILCAGIAISCIVLPHFEKLNIANAMSPYLTINSFLFLMAGVATLFLMFKMRVRAFFYIVFSTAIGFLLVLSASTGAINQKTIKPLAVQIKPILQPNDEVVAYYKYYQDLPIYLERRITIVADWQASDIPLNDNWVRELWYGMPFQDTKDWLIEDEAFWQRWNGEKRLFVFTDVSYLKDLQARSKNKVYKIGQHNHVLLLSNQPGV